MNGGGLDMTVVVTVCGWYHPTFTDSETVVVGTVIDFELNDELKVDCCNRIRATGFWPPFFCSKVQ